MMILPYRETRWGGSLAPIGRGRLIGLGDLGEDRRQRLELVAFGFGQLRQLLARTTPRPCAAMSPATRIPGGVIAMIAWTLVGGGAHRARTRAAASSEAITLVIDGGLDPLDRGEITGAERTVVVDARERRQLGQWCTGRLPQ